MRGELRVEVVEHHPRFDHGGAGLRVEFDQPVEVLGDVNDQRLVNGLADLRGAAAARQHRHAGLTRDLQGRQHVVAAGRYHHAEREHLVDRGVGRVAAATEGVAQHLATDGGAQALFEGGIDGVHRLC